MEPTGFYTSMEQIQTGLSFGGSRGYWAISLNGHTGLPTGVYAYIMDKAITRMLLSLRDLKVYRDSLTP